MTALVSERISTELDPREFSIYAQSQGFGDGLPCIPPTESLVAEYVAASGRAADELIARLPPLFGACTVEKIAVNAVMAGAPVAAMPLFIASIEAMAVPGFGLENQNATTAPVVPIHIVNGAVRHELDIPFKGGCFGGALGNGASIGRAIRLMMRNIAGQEPSVTSVSTFGQPARVAGLVLGEWEEESPWAPLAERRGVSGDAVTVYGAMGTANIVDTIAAKGEVLLELIGKSLAYIGNNQLAAVVGNAPGEVVVALNPTWANEVIARDIPSIEDVQQILWQHAYAPIDYWPEDYRQAIYDVGRVESDGRVHVVPKPEDIIIFVCGGQSSLHATMMHSYGHLYAATVPV